MNSATNTLMNNLLHIERIDRRISLNTKTMLRN